MNPSEQQHVSQEDNAAAAQTLEQAHESYQRAQENLARVLHQHGEIHREARAQSRNGPVNARNNHRELTRHWQEDLNRQIEVSQRQLRQQSEEMRHHVTQQMEESRREVERIMATLAPREEHRAEPERFLARSRRERRRRREREETTQNERERIDSEQAQLRRRTEHVVYVDCPSAEEIIHDKLAPEGGAVCIICQENSPLCIALPCLHMAYCIGCARTLCLHRQTGQPQVRGTVNCAKCRKAVDAVSRVFSE